MVFTGEYEPGENVRISRNIRRGRATISYGTAIYNSPDATFWFTISMCGVIAPGPAFVSTTDKGTGVVMGEQTRVKWNLKVFCQSQRNSCWLAAYKMLLAFKGKDYSDKAISRAFQVKGLDFDTSKTKGLAEAAFPKACDALGLQLYGVPFGYGKADDGAAKVLVSFLRNAGPLWVAGNWTGYNHVHVVSGADMKRNMLCCIDPWNDGITCSEPLWVDFDSYVSKVKVRVKGGIQH